MIDINLAIPHVQFVPSLDELQQVLNKAARYIVETGKSITAWGQHRIQRVEKVNEYGEDIEVIEDIPSENLQNWYPVIQSNKGTFIIIMSLLRNHYVIIILRFCKESYGIELCS